ncbi:uncharacterized protein LTR77_005318 [Saxophila tyrrhenica]|uniref:Major facilitator superfamily (MFS) profile domain-containing protein n=1 Tax=Saxophila tyrrhenica TaxID=1690608 RepID=A0AAV9P862_9PEZI|nr:hypothetical protein LTR77_005318 [Saxophila tyrrhenica]
MDKNNMSSQLEHADKSGEEYTHRIDVTTEQEASIRKHFDRRVVPIVCTLYVLSYLDRGNIGNAKTAGADEDLGLDDSEWTWVLNAFYICYVCFEWTTILWKIFPAHIYVAALCLLWGACAMSAGSVQDMSHLIACRAFLGIFEASFGAGAPYFLSLFYQRTELAFRTSLLLGMAPLANTFASALAYGISQIQGSLAPWRLIFLIEGAPTVLFAPVVFFLLPDSPGTAKFLTEEEQRHALERFKTLDHTAKNHIHWKQFLAGATDYRNIMHMLIHFMCNFSFAGLSNFLPTIVEGMGYESINAQGLTAPVYFTSFLCCVAAALISDRWGKRGFVIMAFAGTGCIGYLLLAALEHERYNNITWLLNNNTNESKRGAGLAILAIFGQCSSFLSSAMFPDADAPFFVKGNAIGCGFTGSIVLLAAGLYFRMRYLNKQKDALHGTATDNEQLDVTDLGESHPGFRYLL